MLLFYCLEISPTPVNLQCNQVLANSHLVFIVFVTAKAIYTESLTETFVFISKFSHDELNLLAFLYFFLVVSNDGVKN
jgi:hypothetical protein